MEAVWAIDSTTIGSSNRAHGGRPGNLRKSADWKFAIAAALKRRTTVTNRWQTTPLNLDNCSRSSRKVAAWMRNPEPSLCKRLQITPNPKPPSHGPQTVWADIAHWKGFVQVFAPIAKLRSDPITGRRP